MVPGQARGHLPAQQQVSAGDVHRPDRDPYKLLQEEGGLHQQEQGETGVLAQLGHAERQQGAHQEVRLVLCRFEYTKEVLNEMAAQHDKLKA